MAGVNVITRENLAKEWGISANVIDNMLQSGQLRKISRGLIDYDHAKTVRAGQDPAQRERGMVGAAMSQATEVAAPAERAPTNAGDLLLRARAAKVVADAEASKLQLAKLKGTLVETEAVKREAQDVGRLIVGRLNALPSRLGPMLASISDATECTAAIKEEIDALVAEIREGLAAL